MLMNNHAAAAAHAGFHCEFQCSEQHRNNQQRQNLEIEIFFYCVFLRGIGSLMNLLQIIHTIISLHFTVLLIATAVSGHFKLVYTADSRVIKVLITPCAK